MLTSEEVIPSSRDEDDGQLSRRCRFCAEVRPSHDEDEEGDTPEGGWAEVWDDVELQKRVYYYTPIRMLSSSPFPSLLCPRCLRLLSLVREFFVLLNEGQVHVEFVVRYIFEFLSKMSIDVYSDFVEIVSWIIQLTFAKMSTCGVYIEDPDSPKSNNRV